MRYFVILTQQEKDNKLYGFLISKLGQELTDQTMQGLGYDKLENYKDLTISDVSLSVQELEDGTFVCSTNLANPVYLPNKCAFRNLTSEQFELIKVIFGEENLIDENQRRELKFETIE